MPQAFVFVVFAYVERICYFSSVLVIFRFLSFFVMATTHIVDAGGRRFFSHHVASANALLYQGKKPQISARSYLV